MATSKSYAVPDSAIQGYSPILRNPDSAHSLEIEGFDGVNTLYEIFARSNLFTIIVLFFISFICAELLSYLFSLILAVRNTPDSDYLGHRPYDPVSKTYLPYVFQTYSQISDRASNLAAGLIALRLSHSDPTSDTEKSAILDRKWAVAIYSLNRPEWAITDKALPTQSLYSVALYDTLGHDSMEYILNHSEASIVVCSLDKIHKLLSQIDRLPHLKIIVSMDPLSYDSEKSSSFIPSPFNSRSTTILKEWAKSKNVGLYDFHEVEKVGADNHLTHHPPAPSDIYTILYTSGTTGVPKGAVTTHRNYASAAVVAAKRAVGDNTPNSMVSYLPLAHCYGRNSENSIILNSGSIGYYCGDITKILEDTRALQPTIFTGVPRLLTRFYDALSAKTINSSNPIVRSLAQLATSQKINNMHAGLGLEHFLWDRIFFNKTQAVISKNLKFISTGSAPIESNVLNFLRVSLKSIIRDGYGMTETSAIVLAQTMTDFTAGNSGIPFEGMEVRLRDVPEMNYLTSDSPCMRGELLVRGPTIFSCYYKDPVKTEEAFVDGNWLATGDIARINEDGTISIIDRKKSIFKLSQGEYVAPEKVENIITRNPFVLQCFVHGYSYKNYLVAIVVPDPDQFIPWASKIMNSSEPLPIAQLAKNKKVIDSLLAEITAISKESNLAGFEIVKKVYIEPASFESHGLLTPTLKLKRFDAAKHYKDIITSLYQS
ncbi:Long-chain-fatty-acid-CoA ligase 5 [Smittium mucronatum]|uniref:Long-chain-fatty-acid-CoA ligase 5 n=1 Tax=Smittium mucronatum TaxID=133383 RepID=A0A1R0GQ94_9FUNG|nr:Long-chain-fatty-acid-CoA ligase 5 [Smittium mucronatum]